MVCTPDLLSTGCVARVSRPGAEMDGDKTTTSIDGVGAFDRVSRAVMLTVLRKQLHGCAHLPFVQMFYLLASEYLWSGGEGATNKIKQGEGGEQSSRSIDASSVRIGPALNFGPGEQIFAFVDDIYVVSDPRSSPSRSSVCSYR